MVAPTGTSEPLPPLYAAWAREFLGGPIPVESRATCDDCAMCAHGDEQQSSRTDYFNPAVKCCTYIPDLHNFLVGRILSDDDTAAERGRTTVEKRIQESLAVTPLGLTRPPVYSLLYENNTNAFGKSRTLLCPYYIEDGGQCGIWRNREATCATWFCKYVRGDVGYVFWRESLHQLLMVVERDLARWSVLELDLGSDALRHLVATAAWRRQSEPVTGASIDNRVDRDSYGRIWGRWLGREGEFFIECARLVSSLLWADVLAICGPEARAYAQLTEKAYDRLTSDEIPVALKVGSIQLVQITHDLTRVSTYNDTDPIDIPSVVMELLNYFDGRQTEEALATIARERGIRLDPSLVRKMVDFTVLVPTE